MAPSSQGKRMEIFEDFHSRENAHVLWAICESHMSDKGIQTGHRTTWVVTHVLRQGTYTSAETGPVPELSVTQASTVHTCETVAISPPQMEGERGDMTLK